jgi:ComF family protein
MWFSSKGIMRRTFETWADRATKLLGPGQGECRYCKAAYRIAAAGAGSGAGYPAGLCRDCSRAIPWIREIVCSVCGRYEACPDCVRRSATYFVRNRSAVAYDDRMKAWLARYKYRGDERLAELLADVLLHAYRLHGLAEREDGTLTLLTFVPLSDARKQDRGFNQAEQLARMLGRRLRLPVVDLLKRNRHTEKQSLKSRGERLKDMRDLFLLHEAGLGELRQRMQSDAGEPPRIYVIDDVYTTGSTLNECAKSIRAGADARVYGLTLAR